MRQTPVCDPCEDTLEQAARREGRAARSDLWLALLLLTAWSVLVAAVAAQFGGGA